MTLRPVAQDGDWHLKLENRPDGYMYIVHRTDPLHDGMNCLGLGHEVCPGCGMAPPDNFRTIQALYIRATF